MTSPPRIRFAEDVLSPDRVLQHLEAGGRPEDLVRARSVSCMAIKVPQFSRTGGMCFVCCPLVIPCVDSAHACARPLPLMQWAVECNQLESLSIMMRFSPKLAMPVSCTHHGGAVGTCAAVREPFLMYVEHCVSAKRLDRRLIEVVRNTNATVPVPGQVEDMTPVWEPLQASTIESHPRAAIATEVTTDLSAERTRLATSLMAFYDAMDQVDLDKSSPNRARDVPAAIRLLEKYGYASTAEALWKKWGRLPEGWARHVVLN